MPRYTDDSLARVRDAVDIVDLIGTRTELRRSGPGTFKGLCPFHDERSPSFSVDQGKGFYHCFGCGVGGDAITFVRELEGLDFPAALEWLAGRYGVELEVADEDPAAAERRRRRERLLELLERASRFYVRHLWESPEARQARDYLAGRGLEEQTLREFRVGWAPDSWDALLTAARRQGFGDQELVDAGLAGRRDRGGIYDFLRGRIMFPLCDLRGHVLGFGGRTLVAGQPKYVNTREGVVFHKGRNLFGADVARVHATKSGTAVVVEGYTDVLMLHQAGVRNAVGVMGTALTEEQVAELSRLAQRVLLAMDPDESGQEAMLKAARVAAGRKLELRVVPLPEGRDPADVVQADGPAAAQALVEHSIPFVRFQVERALARGDLASAEGKDAVIDELRPVFAGLAPSVLREELVGLVAERLDLAPDLVGSWLPAPGAPAPQRRAPGPGSAAAAPVVAVRAGRHDDRAERAFLLACLAAPGEGERALAEVPEEVFSSEPLRRAAQHLRAHLRSPGDALPEDDPQFVALIAGLVAGAGRIETPTATAVRAQLAALRLADLDRRIAEAKARRAGGIAALRREREALHEAYDDLVRDQMAATKAADD